MITARKEYRFCGREFTPEELSLIREVVVSCGGLSRTELASTICELLGWKRANGGLKSPECFDLLERLEEGGFLTLPRKRETRARQPKERIASPGEPDPTKLPGDLKRILPLEAELVRSQAQRDLFKGLVGQYHYLGYAMPYGARLQYLVQAAGGRQVVGCVQFSSPAWRMKARDRWIGWDDAARERGLQHIVNNSRLLVLARVRNLASALLACVLRRLPADWQEHYGVEPFLVETLVDRERFYGGCYRAANWLVLGETSGRGRMDRKHLRHGARVKTVLVYPLVRDAARRLRGQGR